MKTVFSLIFIAAMILVSPAAAQPVCTDRSNTLKNLEENYSEVPVSMGLTTTGAVVEILSSKSGNSWTIILTMPNGMTCMIAAGENWKNVIPRNISAGPAT